MGVIDDLHVWVPPPLAKSLIETVQLFNSHEDAPLFLTDHQRRLTLTQEWGVSEVLAFFLGVAAEEISHWPGFEGVGGVWP